MRLQECDFRDAEISLNKGLGGEKAMLYAAQSSLRAIDIWLDEGSFHLDGCTVSGSIRRGGATGVIRDSTVRLRVQGAGTMYLVNNVYKNDMEMPDFALLGNLRMDKNDVWVDTNTSSYATTTILGKGSDPLRLTLSSDECVAEGVDLLEPAIIRGTLSLHNAAVHGGVWDEPFLRRSAFHTVALHPAMKLSPDTAKGDAGAQKQRLSVFAVSEPEGSPWEGKAPATRPGSSDWRPLSVPTVEELGLADLRDMR
jgi:hypothetical protein